jgi:DNA polymerase III epsilon subunit-like protein
MRTYPGLVHANGNLLCSVDWETTGRRPGYHEIIQVAFVPLDSEFRPLAGVRPFYQNIKPQFPERAQKMAMKINGLSLEQLMQHAPDAGKVADLLREWFEDLDLPVSKCLMPLAHNWSFESAFATAWLGEDEMSAIFHAHFRDSQALATHVNDVCAFHGERIPFPSVSLHALCKYLGVENLTPHDALSDAIAGAGVYRSLIQMLIDLSV